LRWSRGSIADPALEGSPAADGRRRTGNHRRELAGSIKGETAMRIARKLVLLCAMALAAMALAASTASAQEEEVRITSEVGAHCDPCIVHAVGEADLEFFGIPVSTCEDEFEAELYENPEIHLPDQEPGEQGHVIDYDNNAATSTQCTRINCNGVGEAAAESEWEMDELGETGPNEGHFHVDFCLDNKNNPNGTGVHCPSAEIHIEEEESENHHYIVSADHVCPSGVHVIGEWNTEVDPTEHEEIEIVHT
jgi:hypothetical protein